VSDVILGICLAVGTLLTGAVLVLAWLLYGPSIDDAFQWTAPRFIRAVKTSLLPEVTGPGATWWVTRFEDGRRQVSCVTQTPAGLADFHWEVCEGFSPAESYVARPGFFVVPLTRATLSQWPGTLPTTELHRLPDRPCWVGSLVLRELGVAPKASFFGPDVAG